MNRHYLILFLVLIASPLPMVEGYVGYIPPTPAIKTIQTQNGTVESLEYNQIVNFIGNNGIFVSGNNNSKTVTFGLGNQTSLITIHNVLVNRTFDTVYQNRYNDTIFLVVQANQTSPLSTDMTFIKGLAGISNPPLTQLSMSYDNGIAAASKEGQIIMMIPINYYYEITKTNIGNGSSTLNSWIEYTITGVKGDTGPQGPTGATGATGPQGPRGYNGTNGANGLNGTNGSPGSQIYTGSGSPSSGLGINGDFYINTINGDYYQKSSGSWVLKGNLTGPQGPTGATGATGPQGPRGYNGTNGANGSNGTNGKNGINGTEPYSKTCTSNQYFKSYDNTTRNFGCDLPLNTAQISNAQSGGIGLFGSRTNATQNTIKVLIAGPNVNIISNATSATISATDTNTAQGTNIGSGQASIYSGNNNSTQLKFKTIDVIGSGSISNGSNKLVINTKTYQNNTGNNVGTGKNVYNSTNNSGVLQFNTLAAGTGLSISLSNGTLTFTNTGVTSISVASGNLTSSASTGAVSLNLGSNVLISGGSPQTVTKNFTLNKGVLGGNLNVGTNYLINSGHKINLPNNTGTICLTNQTGTCGPNSGVTSVNALTGALNIAGVAGNTTISSGGSTITINTAYNVVVTGGSSQEITKQLTLDSLRLGGNAVGNNKNFTGLNQVNATKFYQGTKQVIDTITGSSHISVSGSGNSRTLTYVGTDNNTAQGTNVGGGQASVYSGNSNNTQLQFKTIDVIGSGSISNGSNKLVINTKTYQNNTGSNLGTSGTGVYNRTDNGVLKFNSIKAGTNISTQLSNGTITISSSGGGTGSGSYNRTLANNVLVNKGGFKLNFINGTNNPIKILNSSSGTQVNITISDTKGISSVTGTNLTSSGGLGYDVFKNITNTNNVNYRTLLGGPTLTLTQNASSILFNDTGTNADLSFYHKNNVFYSSNRVFMTFSTMNLASSQENINATFAYPFIVGKGFSISQIGWFAANTNAANKCRVGLYDDNGTMYPRKMIVNGTDQSSSSSGFKTDSVSANLNSNSLYWFVYNCKGGSGTLPQVAVIPPAATPNILGVNSTTPSGTLSASTLTTAQIAGYVIRSQNHNSTSFSLPNTFPSNGIYFQGLNLGFPTSAPSIMWIFVKQ